MLSPLRNRAGRRLREPFGKAGLIVGVIALVFAMLGGAYAASGLNSKQKKEVKAIAKSFQGTAPAGAQGPAGAKGDAGAAGAKGDTGSAGAAGAAGTSVKTKSFAGAKGGCTEGGIEVESASPTVNVCNGAKGTTGFTKTLPKGETETGAWSYGKTTTGPRIHVTASFPIPLATAIAAGKAHLIYVTGKELVENETTEEIEEVTKSTDCPGTVEAPSAVAGSFCMYAANMEGTLNTGIFTSSLFIASPGAGIGGGGATGKTGVHLTVLLFSGSSEGWGTWAVTAP